MNKEVPNTKQYVMATIMMPIEVIHLDKEEYICLKERAKISLAFCDTLPEVAKEGEGFGGLSEKLHDLYEKQAKAQDSYNLQCQSNTNILHESQPNKICEPRPPSSSDSKKGNRKNITFRRFRENIQSHRYTFRNFP
jgi:hypothetical protein